MKFIYSPFIFLLSLGFSGSVFAGWFDSEEDSKKERANLIVSECVEMIQQDYDNKKNPESKVKVEVFAGDIKILSEDVVLTEVIILSSTSNYISKQEKEGVCRYIPESKNIAWQPFAL
jgi:hypothetical protein